MCIKVIHNKCGDSYRTCIKYKDSKGFGVALSAPTSTRHIVLNGQNPVLADIHVRKALQHATNRVAIAKGMFHNTELPADTLYARSVPYCDIDLKPYEYDMPRPPGSWTRPAGSRAPTAFARRTASAWSWGCSTTATA